jgi:hypothetical protein
MDVHQHLAVVVPAVRTDVFDGDPPICTSATVAWLSARDFSAMSLLRASATSCSFSQPARSSGAGNCTAYALASINAFKTTWASAEIVGGT